MVIIDNNTDEGKNEQGKDYIVRELLNNNGVFNFYLLDGRRFKNETERFAIIESLKNEGYIRRVEGAIGQTYMLTDRFRNEQLMMYKDLAVRKLDQMPDSEISLNQFISELLVPDMYQSDFKKFLELGGYIIITTKTRQGDFFKKGHQMSLYFLNSLMQENKARQKNSASLQKNIVQERSTSESLNTIDMKSAEHKKLKIFIGWSGEKSMAMAKRLYEWLPSIVPDIVIFFSPAISGGANWSNEIARWLKEADYGILCLTNDNLNSPWINFEAGALWKGIGETPVCPLLLNINSRQLTGPLNTFQSKNFDEEGIKQLCRLLAEKTNLDARRVDISFKGIWHQLNKEMNDDLERISKAEPQDQRPYGLKITSPIELNELSTPVRVSGTYDILPPHGIVHAIVLNPRTNEYWPKKHLMYDKRNKTWETEVDIDIKSTQAEERIILIATIGPCMKTLIDFRKKVYDKTKQALGLDDSPILHDDIDVHDEIKIKIASNKKL
ncbi:TIR domain-containing protein [Flavisolibacter ginsenosidimutans]|uniref:Toll/interleukin-1 receptor domain-containing protein n=1 Tax=Flavisolibacter ginsenosidimutans TaxID=661481 RepID=A0A5B8UK18_9BACT|nr:TIR domain-containing protein [Flavisolibacter ginsenosidimutans]QEC56742.1 toll/interleukin-1 receptor domain-containing protein [Flavisolibacter ginsenosidimutans]